MPNLTQKLLSEAFGTCFLLIAIVGSGIMAENLAPQNEALQLLANSIAVAATLVVIITQFAPLSGAHFNPLVSFGELKIKEAAFYSLTQIFAAILGVYIAHIMFDLTPIQTATKARGTYGVYVSEFIATFGLILLLNVTKHLPSTKIAKLVALYILAAFWFTASTSFANPAVTIARTLTNTPTGIAVENAVIFIILQILAAFCAKITANMLLKKD